MRAVPAAQPRPSPDAPWENSLGMRFLPLDGSVQMSQWKTRVRDFAAFAAASGYGRRRRHGPACAAGPTRRRARPGASRVFRRRRTHPVVGVSWKDAYAFLRTG